MNKLHGDYTLIYADPPWQYRDRANSGKRGASHKYPVMNIDDLKRLPVWSLAAENCLLAMWWVGPMPQDALDLVSAWGFRLMTMKGFTWHKIYAKSKKDCMGMGHMTRANSEDVLFAVKGKLPERVMANIIQHISTEEEHITAERGEHSAKPAIFREKLEALLGDVPRIELFGRGDIDNWHSWGNDCPCNVELDIGGFKAYQGERKPNDWDEELDGPWSPSVEDDDEL